MNADQRYVAGIFHETNSIERGNFTLASGEQSEYYIDAKKAMLDSRALKVVCRWFWSLVTYEPFEALGCIEMGGNHILGGILATAPHGAQGFIYRKESKKHGLQKMVEGHLQNYYEAFLIEDVVTSGSSVIRVAKELKKQNVFTSAIMAVVDRSKGTMQKRMAEEGLTHTQFYSFITIDELLNFKL